MSTILWRPDAVRAGASNLAAFRLWLGTRGVSVPDFASLWRWSVEDLEGFWNAMWDFAGLIGEKGTVALENPDAMPGARFFPEAHLSYAENILCHAGEREAVVFTGEDGRRIAWSRDDLRAETASVASALLGLGLGVGDRVEPICRTSPTPSPRSSAPTQLAAPSPRQARISALQACSTGSARSSHAC